MKTLTLFASVETANPSLAGNQLQLMALMAVLSLVPFAVVMLTSFSKFSVVLSMVRSAIGTQQAPPTMVLTGLAAVLTAHVMAPTFEQMWLVSKPHLHKGTSTSEVVAVAGECLAPLTQFLQKHGSAEERARFVDMARELRPIDQAASVSESDVMVVVPAFVITELREAFIIGFLIFLPFLMLDMLIANILLALGMQSLSPAQVSLPFKILLFVVVDGWSLLAHGLIQGYR